MEVTSSDLTEMGLKVDPEDLEASDTPDGTTTRLSNVQRTDQSNYGFGDDEGDDDDESMADGWLRIEYVLADVDGDGIAERYCIYRLQDKILKKEIVSHVPIATASPIINTHRWDGQSIHDLV